MINTFRDRSENLSTRCKKLQNVLEKVQQDKSWLENKTDVHNLIQVIYELLQQIDIFYNELIDYETKQKKKMEYYKVDAKS